MVKSKSYSPFRYAPWCFRDLARPLVLRAPPRSLELPDLVLVLLAQLRELDLQDLHAARASQAGHFWKCFECRRCFEID